MNKKSYLPGLLLSVWVMFFSVIPYASAQGVEQYGMSGLTDCTLYQQFTNIQNDWSEGRLSERNLVLKKAKAWKRSDNNPVPCDPELQELLKQELATDIHRLSDQLKEADKSYLASLGFEFGKALEQNNKELSQVTKNPPNIISRVNAALEKNELGLVDAVMIKAQLLYAPDNIPLTSQFAPRNGEQIAEEGSEQEFIKDLHRVKDYLTAEQRSFLAKLNPKLQAIIKSWDSHGAINALPPYNAFLDKTYEGKNCTVHYTLTNATHKVSSAKYANWVASLVDEAVKKQVTSGHFRAAYAEGGGKLQIYIIDKGADANAEWVDASDVAGSGKRKSGYIEFSNKLDTKYGKTWLTKLRGVSHHEYFHGVQSAYNWASDLWFLEASAVWASCYYGGDYVHLSGYYTAPESIFNVPNQNMWVNTYHKYSMSVLAFDFSGRYGGYKIIRDFLLKTEASDDAIVDLKAALNDRAEPFDDALKVFFAKLYWKTITGIKSYMPDVIREDSFSDYGVGPADSSVQLLGANFYKLDAPSDGRLRKSPLISITKPTGSGNPQGLLFSKKSTQPAPVETGRAYLPKANKEAVLIATDVDYSSKDESARSYNYSVITPYIKLTDINAQSPITGGDTSQIDMTYDLLGVTPPVFPVDFRVTEKGPDVSDNASGTYDMNEGEGQTFTVYFWTTSGVKGTYRFKFDMWVPPETWNIPRVTSSIRTSVVVLPSSSAASKRLSRGEAGISHVHP